jgi:hypothetical protein
MNGMIKADGKGVVVLATVLLVGVMIGGIGFVLGRARAGAERRPFGPDRGGREGAKGRL